MATTYDWSPLFDAINKSTNDWSQRSQYNAVLNGLIGKQVPGQVTPGTPGMAPQQTTIDATAPNIPGAPAPVQRSVSATIPGMDATAGTQGAPTYDGMAGQALGSNMAAMLPIFRNLPPQVALPLLLNAGMKNADRKQSIEDARVTPLSDDEAKLALGAAWKPDAKYGKDISGNIVTTQKGETLSQAAVNQQLATNKQQLLDKSAAPPTQAELLDHRDRQATLGETRRYHNQMVGQGLTEDGAPNPIVQSWKGQVASGNATLQNVPLPLRSAVAVALNSEGKSVFTPIAAQRNTLAASRITHPYTNMAAYKLTADGLPYLQRIDAALKHPGSVSDQDLLDSLTKLNTGGNAVTEAQVSLITGHGSLSDWAGTVANKLKNGGALSDNQRKQIKDIANDIFKNYQKGYQPVYEEAKSKLQAAGIPEPFWTIPDLNKLNAGQEIGAGGGKTVVRTGTEKGTNRKVIQYSDGTTEYAR